MQVDVIWGVESVADVDWLNSILRYAYSPPAPANPFFTASRTVREATATAAGDSTATAPVAAGSTTSPTRNTAVGATAITNAITKTRAAGISASTSIQTSTTTAGPTHTTVAGATKTTTAVVKTTTVSASTGISYQFSILTICVALIIQTLF